MDRYSFDVGLFHPHLHAGFSRRFRVPWPDPDTAFRVLCDAAEVGAQATMPPRIHDLRHTFAVNTLLGWYRDGADVQARLPSLSTYLGHRKPSDTYHYLSAAPELLAHAAGLLDAATEVAS